MEVRIINREGKVWEFSSMKEARPHIKKKAYYRMENSVRIFDDRDQPSKL